MKTGKTLAELAAEIERRADNKRDLIVGTQNLQMMVADGQDRPALAITGQPVIGINAIAHEQIASHVDIPKKYYDRMLAEAPGLLANNVNEWFAKYPADRMVRTLDGKARAFLSNGYRPLENEDLAQAVLPVLLDMDLDIMSSEITDRRLYIKAVDKKVTRELAKHEANFGDGGHTIVRCLSPAITISNSEVGQGALAIMAGTYDSFCSNLASFGERSMRKYHVGKKTEIEGEALYALLSDKTRRLSDAALWAQTADVVRAAFERAKFDALVDKIEGTKSERIDGDPVKVVELSAKRFGLTEATGKGILRALIEGADLSRFGLHNAITRVAQDVADYDDATAMERMGGQVIEMPANEWRELALAA